MYDLRAYQLHQLNAQLVPTIQWHHGQGPQPDNLAPGPTRTKGPAQAIGPIGHQRTCRRNTTSGAAITAAALADPRRPQGLLKRVLSHFAYGESLAVRTRICCVVGGRPDSPKDLKGP